jgi:putative heme-binding domain-containing protein
VREHALRLAERFGLSAGLAKRFEELVNDSDPRVRYQLAFTLGSFRQESATAHLAELARKDGENSSVRFAVLCSAGERGADLFARLLEDDKYRATTSGKALLLALVAQTAAANRPADLPALGRAIDALPDSEKALARELVLGFVSSLPSASRDKLTGKAGAILKEVLTDATKTASNDKADPTVRAAAVRALALAPFADAKPVLAKCLDVRQPQPVQLAALGVLARYDSADVPALVLTAWPSMSPKIRATAIETLLGRSTWVGAFLDAVEKKVILPTDLEPARVQLLLKAPDEKVRTRAAKLFAGAGPSKRQDVIAKYQKALELRGDAARGKAVFKDSCASCHKLEGVGEAIGPDLAAIKNRGSEAVLVNVLDPNREVLPQYYTYLLTTDDDTIISGMIVAETANTVTIRKTDGMSETVQRVNIQSLRSTGLSAMPEGLEEKIDLQAMADLLAYLNSIK